MPANGSVVLEQVFTDLWRFGHDAQRVGDRWTIDDSSELYDVARWGNGYFSVGARAICWFIRTVIRSAFDRPERIGRTALQMRGVDLPILVRFSGILKDRIEEIQQRLRPGHRTNTITRVAIRWSIR